MLWASQRRGKRSNPEGKRSHPASQSTWKCSLASAAPCWCHSAALQWSPSAAKLLEKRGWKPSRSGFLREPLDAVQFAAGSSRGLIGNHVVTSGHLKPPGQRRWFHSSQDCSGSFWFIFVRHRGTVPLLRESDPSALELGSAWAWPSSTEGPGRCASASLQRRGAVAAAAQSRASSEGRGQEGCGDSWTRSPAGSEEKQTGGRRPHEK